MPSNLGFDTEPNGHTWAYFSVQYMCAYAFGFDLRNICIYPCKVSILQTLGVVFFVSFIRAFCWLIVLFRIASHKMSLSRGK